jgi:hypothetical protein
LDSNINNNISNNYNYLPLKSIHESMNIKKKMVNFLKNDNGTMAITQ